MKKKQRERTYKIYPPFDENIAYSMLMCGIATGISCLFFGITPFAVIFYIMSVLEKTYKYIDQSVFVLVACAIATLGCLIVSVIAKIKNRKSKWAVVNIVYISISLVISILISGFFIWLVSRYNY